MNDCCNYVIELVVNYSSLKLTKASFPEYTLLRFPTFTNRMSLVYSQYSELLFTQKFYVLCVEWIFLMVILTVPRLLLQDSGQGE
jgi:hypothetical protein